MEKHWKAVLLLIPESQEGRAEGFWKMYMACNYSDAKLRAGMQMLPHAPGPKDHLSYCLPTKEADCSRLQHHLCGQPWEDTKDLIKYQHLTPDTLTGYEQTDCWRCGILLKTAASSSILTMPQKDGSFSYIYDTEIKTYLN